MSGIMSMVLGAKTAIAAAVDAYFNLVTLLLPGDGTNGAQNNTFLDSSSNNFTITRNGNVTQGTFSPFSQSGWSNYFNGSSGFRFADSADFSMGTNAFTIECFVYLTKTQSAGSGFISQWIDANDSNSSWQLGVDWNGGAGGNKFAGQISIGGTVTTINDTTNYALNTWHHVVLCRSGSPGTTALFVNGVRVASSTVTGSIVDATNPVGIGVRGGSDSYYQDGVYISNARIVNGTDVYGATNTTLTVPTAPLTAVTNTKLLTCQSNRFLDTNTQVAAKAVSQVLGTPSVQPFSPFTPTAAYSASTNGGSGYFDGTGDYLTAASNAAFGYGTGDFDIQGWFYATSLPTGVNAAYVIDQRTTATEVAIAVYVYGDSTLNLYVNGSTVISGGAVRANQFNFIQVSRSSGTTRMFLNGTQVGSNYTDSNNYAAKPVAIGSRYNGQDYLQGYISGFRILKGTGFSTSTIPTAPPTAITNTQLLLNFTNGGIIDATGKNVLETVGNAQISTTQSKFGGSSMYFDGTGDYLTTYDPTYKSSLGSGDWTFECWVYVVALPASSSVPTAFYHLKNDSALATTVFVIELSNTGAINLSTGTSLIASGTAGKITTGSWIHFACVRYNGTIKTYFNGTSDISVANTTTYNGSYVQIGAWRYSGYDYSLNGYMDDVRITKYARYTSSFTPPTAAFATQ